MIISDINKIKSEKQLKNFSEKELNFANEKIVPSRRKQWLIGRLAAKKAVRTLLLRKRKTKVDLSNIEIIPNIKGMPVCTILNPENFSVSVSISHTKNIVCAEAAFLNDNSVGIDLEQIRIFPKEFCQRFLSKKELKLISSDNRQNKDFLFTLYWSVKEAFLKALGEGIRIDPLKVEIVKNNKKLEIKLNGNFLESVIKYKLIFDEYVLVTVKIKEYGKR